MARVTALLSAAALLGLTAAQSVGAPDIHPMLDTYECTKSGGCKQLKTSVVQDVSAHWIHQKNSTANCGPGNGCSTVENCYENCVVEGISNYTANGVTTSGSSMNMQMLSPTGSVLSPRVYLLAENQTDYQMMHLTGHELSFDVDMSKLPCGMNAALYLSEMPANGGQGPESPAGAAYGEGYCDGEFLLHGPKHIGDQHANCSAAQCPKQTWSDGLANVNNYGACCNEMDIWEANRAATALTPHTCNETGLYQCTGDLCGFSGVCDQWGCSDNPYKNGNPHYYGLGAGFNVDTSRPFTVVTQFPAFPNGTLQQINRLYVQDGKIIGNAAQNETGMQPWTSIDTAYCEANDGGSHFLDLGGMPTIGGALTRGMVLIFSIWWDTSGNMTWLDSGSAGPCTADESGPVVIQKEQPDVQVTWSNIKWGEINSTFTAGGCSTKARRGMATLPL
jgi:cellulase